MESAAGPVAFIAADSNSVFIKGNKEKHFRVRAQKADPRLLYRISAAGITKHTICVRVIADAIKFSKFRNDMCRCLTKKIRFSVFHFRAAHK